jgi:hypothetical protein
MPSPRKLRPRRRHWWGPLRPPGMAPGVSQATARPRVGLRSHVRTCVQACVRLPGAACRPTCTPARAACGPVRGFARPDSEIPTPFRLLRIAFLADGKSLGSKRNLVRTIALCPPVQWGNLSLTSALIATEQTIDLRAPIGCSGPTRSLRRWNSPASPADFRYRRTLSSALYRRPHCP